MSRREPIFRLLISLIQAGQWNMLINRYISAIPPNGNSASADEHSTTEGPLIAVSTAMPAKAGAAARLRLLAAMREAASPFL
jgi:hypothetical protein